ncbi:MAG: MFS transporter, partial [Acidimicrobiales bacterium]
MAVTSTILYYLYYLMGTVSPKMIPYYHMSFLYILTLLAVSNAIGAFTAWVGGLTDKIGRANLTIYGALLLGIIQLGIPHIHSKFDFAVAFCVVGIIEGVILVSTAALMRDFSPQMGRATAMGFWALGPTAGSLIASLVATRTLHHLHPWQDQYDISGVVCMVVVVIAFLFLRELSPQLRDQLMVTEHERALVEARARGIDVKKAMEHPLRSILHPELIASSLGISVYFLFYFASVSVMTVYWVVVFNRSTVDANGINTWGWAFDCCALVLVGLISDRLRVRKPFIVLGTIATMVMMILFTFQVDHSHAGYYSNVLFIVLMMSAIGFTYSPWMAHYTERVEAYNPALVATGLAL